MKLNADQVRKVAKLGNLELTEGEEEKYSEQLSKILEYVEELNSVDTKDVNPTFNVVSSDNVYRADKESESLSQDEALLNAPVKKDGYFVSAGIFKEE